MTIPHSLCCRVLLWLFYTTPTTIVLGIISVGEHALSILEKLKVLYPQQRKSKIDTKYENKKGALSLFIQKRTHDMVRPFEFNTMLRKIIEIFFCFLFGEPPQTFDIPNIPATTFVAALSFQAWESSNWSRSVAALLFPGNVRSSASGR